MSPSRFFDAIPSSQRTYAVGNSLTEDSDPFGEQTALARDSYLFWETDYHITHSVNLSFIVANPSTWNEVQPSQWNIALPAVAYDAGIFEPYLNATNAQEIAAFITLAQAMRADHSPRLYVYETWPQQPQFDPTYTDYWTEAFTPQPSDIVTQQRAVFDYIYQQLQTTFDSNVYVVPAGSVFNAIDIAARAGHIPGVASVGDLYRDDTHMGDVGRFVAACTVFSTLFREQAQVSAKTLATFIMGEGTVTLTMALAQQMEAIVWGVVSTDPRAIH